MAFSGPSQRLKETPRRRLPPARQIIRLVLSLPFRLLRFILLLPVRLPRYLWLGWKKGALLLYRLRRWLARSPEVFRWFRRHAPIERLCHALYYRLHPARLGHLIGCLLTRLRGHDVWSAAPGLDVIPKALRWARQYRRHQARFRDIEALRSILYARQDTFETRYGPLSIGYLARRYSTRPRWGALLHGMVLYSEAQRVLELGTGFGVSGMYLARGLLDVYPVRTCLLITIEREAQFARIASENFYRLGFHDFVAVVPGDFEHRLAQALKQIAPVSLAFIDGHHQENAILRDFSQIKARSRTGTLIVLSGIHQSPGMGRAWRTIKDMPRIAATVDLWRWGIVVVGNGPPRHVCARL